MRKLTDHIVAGDSANHQLQVNVTDERGQENANHRYEIEGFCTEKNPSEFTGSARYGMSILFQNGPILEVGANGITDEVLLAILIDRMRSFQAGLYCSRANAISLTHMEEALLWLQKRTADRIKRGAEGTHEK